MLSCCFLPGSSIVEGKVFRLMPGLGIFEHHTVRIKGIAGHHSQAVITVHKDQFPVLGLSLIHISHLPHFTQSEALLPGRVWISL